MKDFSDLNNRLQLTDLKLVTQRNGVSVYQGYSLQQKVFVKITKNKVVNERYCEVLEALTKFLLTPNVLDKFEWNNSSVIIMSAIEGTQADQILQHCTQAQKESLFYDLGVAIGRLHQEIPHAHLLNMKCWKDRDGLSINSVLWSKQLDVMISKWVSRINLLSDDYQDFCHQINELIKYKTVLCNPTKLTLLHCDFVGRNILIDKNNNVSGIIDLEAARIGDPIYDLAKIVWVNMEFNHVDLRSAFLNGWEYQYKQKVPPKNFLYYVGIQCIAAIAWTDINDCANDIDTIFRTSAIRTLKIVLNELKQL